MFIFVCINYNYVVVDLGLKLQERQLGDINKKMKVIIPLISRLGDCK